ncbi:hypothetical protein AGABI2DRAFT_141769 [Agaricus bisporus var. bisporus H97]|uniref:hypothetical protein n=1 Tax=Agaricus bisporus var. bisporus (strain H97 / ATCC MYA-4626 / FGSC 10389) TaxID=936046 RepID=UPI00029F5330|nr:hypothetical protein AGABI2DRAFT_141769 [Agaricus bisporus var. bisporus H97]EKV49077.1 hypothetical protein AGABI2DRAFT_141769 [Agaricus bisporus var. bisporus H97]
MPVILPQLDPLPLLRLVPLRLSFPAWSHPYYATPPQGDSRPVSVTTRSLFTHGSGIPAPPKLTMEERCILDDNKGCCKCRHINPGHDFGQCQNDVPSGDGYKPVVYKLLLPNLYSAHSSQQNSSTRNNSATSTLTSTTSSTAAKCPTPSDNTDRNKHFKPMNAVQEESGDVAAFVSEIDSSDDSFVIPSFISPSRKPLSRPSATLRHSSPRGRISDVVTGAQHSSFHIPPIPDFGNVTEPSFGHWDTVRDVSVANSIVVDTSTGSVIDKMRISPYKRVLTLALVNIVKLGALSSSNIWMLGV